MEEQQVSNTKLVTIALFIATFMSAVEGTIVSTAMPTIVGDLHGVSLMNWVFSIFLLTNAIATPIYGKLADQIGRKPMFIVGITIFIVGSVLSGLSQSMIALIIFRAIQGIGAGSIMPISNTMIADMYSIEKRAQIMGLNSSAWGIASICAPLIGGFIVDNFSWHWIFMINLPIGLLVMIMIMVFFNEKPKKSEDKIDISGMTLLTITLLSMMYAFQLIGQQPIDWKVISACLLISIVFIFWFIRHERTVSDPIIPMDLFNNRTFVVQNAIAALISGFLIGFEVYLPDWTQGILGLKASLAGFAITPSSLMWIVGSFITGRLLVKYSPYQIMNLSLGFVLLGGIIMVLIPAYIPFISFFGISAICGVGFGITITTSTIAVQNQVNPDQVGVATSFNTLSRTLGQSLMMSVFGIFMNRSILKGVRQTDGTTMGMINKLINPQTASELPKHLLPKLRDILYSGLHTVFIIGLILIVAAYLINILDRPTKNN